MTEKVGIPLKIDITAQIGDIRAQCLEEHIQLYLRKRPRWLPERFWRTVIARLLVIGEWQ